jgi:hypothetical protein
VLCGGCRPHGYTAPRYLSHTSAGAGAVGTWPGSRLCGGAGNGCASGAGASHKAGQGRRVIGRAAVRKPGCSNTARELAQSSNVAGPSHIAASTKLSWGGGGGAPRPHTFRHEMNDPLLLQAAAVPCVRHWPARIHLITFPAQYLHHWPWPCDRYVCKAKTECSAMHCLRHTAAAAATNPSVMSTVMTSSVGVLMIGAAAARCIHRKHSTGCTSALDNSWPIRRQLHQQCQAACLPD